MRRRLELSGEVYLGTDFSGDYWFLSYDRKHTIWVDNETGVRHAGALASRFSNKSGRYTAVYNKLKELGLAR